MNALFLAARPLTPVGQRAGGGRGRGLGPGAATGCSPPHGSVTDPAPTLRLALDQNFPTPLMVRSPTICRSTSRSRVCAGSIPGCRAGRSDLVPDVAPSCLARARHQQLQDVGRARRTGRDRADTSCRGRCRRPRTRSAPGSGGVLLELPGLSRRVLPRRSNVFRLAYRRRMAQDGRTRFSRSLNGQAVPPTSSGWRSS